MANYDLTLEAQKDLHDIWEYTFNNWSEAQADKYYRVLLSSFEQIAANPSRLGINYDTILFDLRAYHTQKHMIFYTIQPCLRVLIIRILHERMDFIKNLPLEGRGR